MAAPSAKGCACSSRTAASGILCSLVAGLPDLCCRRSACSSALDAARRRRCHGAPSEPATIADGPATFPWVHLWLALLGGPPRGAAETLRPPCDALLDRGGHVRRAISTSSWFRARGCSGAAPSGSPQRRIYAKRRRLVELERAARADRAAPGSVVAGRVRHGVRVRLARALERHCCLCSSVSGPGLLALAYGALGHRAWRYRRLDASLLAALRSPARGALAPRALRRDVVLDLRAHLRGRALPVGKMQSPVRRYVSARLVVLAVSDAPARARFLLRRCSTAYRCTGR